MCKPQLVLLKNRENKRKYELFHQVTVNGEVSDSSITNMSDVCILQIASSTCIKIKEHIIAKKGLIPYKPLKISVLKVGEMVNI